MSTRTQYVVLGLIALVVATLCGAAIALFNVTKGIPLLILGGLIVLFGLMAISSFGAAISRKPDQSNEGSLITAFFHLF